MKTSTTRILTTHVRRGNAHGLSRRSPPQRPPPAAPPCPQRVRRPQRQAERGAARLWLVLDRRLRGVLG